MRLWPPAPQPFPERIPDCERDYCTELQAAASGALSPANNGEASMKIVGFEAEGGLRLGVVEGDQVIDLQAVDAKMPADLAAVLAANNGDLKPLGDLAKRASASARRPLKGLKFGLPVARPGKILCLGLNYLDHVKEGP